MTDFTVHTPEQLAEHDAATSKRYLEALRELKAKIAALEKDAARWCKLLSCCENDHEIREHIEDAVDVIAFQHQVDFRTLDSMTPTEKIDAAIQFDAAMKGGA